MGMAVGGKKGGAMAEMNVIPLIDILLVLIIIFMVVSQSVQQTGVDAQIPQPPGQDKPQPPADRTIVIQVGWGRDGPRIPLHRR